MNHIERRIEMLPFKINVHVINNTNSNIIIINRECLKELDSEDFGPWHCG